MIYGNQTWNGITNHNTLSFVIGWLNEYLDFAEICKTTNLILSPIFLRIDKENLF